MNYVEFFNNYGKDIDIDIPKDFINYCLDKLCLKNVFFNVIIVNNEDIHKINKEYRNVDRPTDVISFALEDNKDVDVPGLRVLGDIYISYDKVIEQALEYGHSEKREICFLSIHGLLHLLGYNHEKLDDEKKMFSLQKELLEEYGIKK